MGFVEQVVVTMTLMPQGLASGSGRGDIYITLQSPSATSSTLLFKRPYDTDRTVGYSNWPFVSVHFWGEDPLGSWTLTVNYDGTSGQVILSDLSMTIYGTASTPIAVSQTAPISCGSDYYRNASTLECMGSCDFTVRSGYCYDPTQPEEGCVRAAIPPQSASVVLQGSGTVVTSLLWLVCLLM